MKKYDFSTYNVYVPSRKSEEIVVYNTLSFAMVRLPAKNRKPDLSQLSSSNIRELNDLMVIKEPSVDEQIMFQYWTKRNKFGHRSSSFTVFTTRLCNLNCVYCYQNQEQLSVPSQNMSNSMAEEIAHWIERYVLAKDLTVIHLTFYGGEPLLNVECIRVIGSKLLPFVRKKNIRLHSYVITNGTLVNKDSISALLDCNLTQAQVTLDGSEHIHDSRRLKRDGSGSYRETLEGIQTLSRLCPVVIRCNLEPETVPELGTLLDFLADQGLANGKNSISLASTCYTDPVSLNVSSRMSLDQYAEATAKWLGYAKDLGFCIKNPYKQSPCFATREGAFVFDVDGSIYTCSQMAGYSAARTGSINSSTFRSTYFELLTSEFLDERCIRCAYSPICMGGCRANALHATGSLMARVCSREFYEAVVPQIISVLAR